MSKTKIEWADHVFNPITGKLLDGRTWEELPR